MEHKPKKKPGRPRKNLVDLKAPDKEEVVQEFAPRDFEKPKPTEKVNVRESPYLFYVDVYANGKIMETAKFETEIQCDAFMQKKEGECLEKRINIIRAHRIVDDKLIKEKRYVVK